MLKEVLDRLNPNETPQEQLAVFMYELGDLAKCLFRSQFGDGRGYEGESQLALADLIAQSILLCEKKGWDFEKVKEIGIERCIERMEQAINRRLLESMKARSE